MKLCKNSYLIKDYKMHVFYSKYLSPTVYTLETHGKSLKKWACIFPIFHAVVLLHSSNW